MGTDYSKLPPAI